MATAIAPLDNMNKDVAVAEEVAPAACPPCPDSEAAAECPAAPKAPKAPRPKVSAKERAKQVVKFQVPIKKVADAFLSTEEHQVKITKRAKDALSEWLNQYGREWVDQLATIKMPLNATAVENAALVFFETPMHADISSHMSHAQRVFYRAKEAQRAAKAQASLHKPTKAAAEEEQQEAEAEEEEQEQEDNNDEEAEEQEDEAADGKKPKKESKNAMADLVLPLAKFGLWIKTSAPLTDKGQARRTSEEAVVCATAAIEMWLVRVLQDCLSNAEQHKRRSINADDVLVVAVQKAVELTSPGEHDGKEPKTKTKRKDGAAEEGAQEAGDAKPKKEKKKKLAKAEAEADMEVEAEAEAKPKAKTKKAAAKRKKAEQEEEQEEEQEVKVKVKAKAKAKKAKAKNEEAEEEEVVVSKKAKKVKA